MPRGLLALLLLLLAGCQTGAPEGKGPLTAVDDVAETPENTPVVIDVLANDRFDRWDRLELPRLPAHGRVERVGKAPRLRLRYTPKPHFHGEDAFSYRLCEGGACSTARVSITVRPVNDPPTAALEARPDAGEVPLAVHFRITAEDPDGDALTCRLDYGDGAADEGACDLLYAHAYAKPGRYTATLVVQDGKGGAAEARATVVARSAFDPVLVFVKAPADPEVRAAFDRAAARWAEVVVGDLPDVADGVPEGACGNPEAYAPPVDDLVIFVNFFRDQEGGLLGRAGPCRLRPETYLPYAGLMEFDEADLEALSKAGILEYVILHEMGHVLGLGTLWEPLGLLAYDADACLDASEVRYRGRAGNDAWHDLGGAGDAPVEEQYGAGTKCGHWREATFDSELMTGIAERGPMPLSRLTIGALADLGYRVNYDAADAYRLPSGAQAQAVGIPLREVLLRPPLP